MALINDPRLFTGGSERIDTRPHVALYAQLKAREAARNDAFDEYMRNVNLKINPAGMRYQDMPAFEHGLKEMQEFGIQNRDAIQNPRKDGGLSAMKFQQIYQRQLNRISESKAASEGLKPLIDVMGDPKKVALLNKDRAMAAEHAHNNPLEIQDESGQFIRNPNFKPFNPSELEYFPEQIEYGKLIKDNFGDLDMSETVEYGKTDPKTGMRDVVTKSFLNKDALGVAASRAANLYATNPRVKMDIDATPIDQLNEAFKSKFGRDIEDESEKAIAFFIPKIQTEKVKAGREDDKYAQALNLEAIKQANRKQLLGMRAALKNAGEKEKGLWVDEYISKTVLESQKPENRTEYKFNNGKSAKGYRIPLDPILRKAIGLDVEKSNGMLIVTDEGDYIIAPYIKNESGGPKKRKDGSYAIDAEKVSRISSGQLKLALSKGAAGVTQTNKEMIGGGGEEIEDDELGILD